MIREQLEAMLDVLDEKDWIQGDLFEGPHGLRGDQQSIPLEDVTGVCLAGAHKYAVLTGMIATDSGWWQVSDIILDAARDLFPDVWTGCWGAPTIPFLNDQKGMTVEDIRLILKTAIEKADQPEGT